MWFQWMLRCKTRIPRERLTMKLVRKWTCIGFKKWWKTGFWEDRIGVWLRDISGNFGEELDTKLSLHFDYLKIQNFFRKKLLRKWVQEKKLNWVRPVNSTISILLQDFLNLDCVTKPNNFLNWNQEEICFYSSKETRKEKGFGIWKVKFFDFISRILYNITSSWFVTYNCNIARDWLHF